MFTDAADIFLMRAEMSNAFFLFGIAYTTMHAYYNEANGMRYFDNAMQ